MIQSYLETYLSHGCNSHLQSLVFAYSILRHTTVKTLNILSTWAYCYTSRLCPYTLLHHYAPMQYSKSTIIGGYTDCLDSRLYLATSVEPVLFSSSGRRCQPHLSQSLAFCSLFLFCFGCKVLQRFTFVLWSFASETLSPLPFCRIVPQNLCRTSRRHVKSCWDLNADDPIGTWEPLKFWLF